MKQTVIIVMLLISAGCQRNAARPTIPSVSTSETKESAARQSSQQSMAFSLLEYKSKNEQIENLTKERNYWQNKYLSALDIVYKQIPNDADKRQLLFDYLHDKNENIRLWAIDKVQQWRLGTKSNLPQEIGQTLTTLVNDPNREIRFKVAKILSLMEGVDSADALLAQIKVEKDQDVKSQMFIALVGTCYYSVKSDSAVKVSENIQKQVYEMAANYLEQKDSQNAQLGANQLSKLLEANGIGKDESAKYLNLFVKRYKHAMESSQIDLRADLLSAMASLCARGEHKEQASSVFGQYFYEALNDKNDLVRENAVDGIINIDNAKALVTLREIVPNENNIKIVKKVVDLAGQIGNKSDIGWLTGKLRTLKDNSDVFKSILRIFEKCESDFVFGWCNNLENHTGILSDSQIADVLEIAANKAETEGNKELSIVIKGRLADIYVNVGNFEKSAKTLAELREFAQTYEQQESIIARLLDVYLRKPNISSAVELVDNCLLQKDLGSNSPIIKVVDRFFAIDNQNHRQQAGEFLEGLKKIKISGQRLNWEILLKGWSEGFKVQKEPNTPRVLGA